jgi:hypothetical protein
MKVKNGIWFVIGIYLLIMSFLLLNWFKGYLIWQPILLFIVGCYCIFKSNVISLVWDTIFPDAEDWDKDENM